MLKMENILEVKKGSNTFKMSLPADATWGDLFDVLLQMQHEVIGKIQESQPKPAEEKVSEEESGE